MKKRIIQKLKILYGNKKGEETFKKLEKIIYNYKIEDKKSEISSSSLDKKSLKERKKKQEWSEKDSILLIYPDQIKGKEKSLKTLQKISKKHFSNFSKIHILPFFQASADRGFSIKEYKKVDSKFGSWQDIKAIKKNFDLVFDLVLNHVSPHNKWFKEFLKQNPKYIDYFISFKKNPAKKYINKIFRPRVSPLFTEFKTKNGKTYVWTTYGKEHIDLNYKNPEVLLEIIDVLLFYIKNGAKIVRLDAVAYIWKELGTSCVHLKKTHLIVKLLRDLADLYGSKLAIETNVGHFENISYFGNGYNESQVIYNFALPLVVLYTFYSKDVRKLNKLIPKLKTKSSETTYLNFLDGHDGIGISGAEGILSDKEIKMVIKKARSRGAIINYKLKDGKNKPYEIATTWHSALMSKKDNEMNIKRDLASRAISLSLKGIPVIHIHGLLGTENDYKTYKKTKISRDLNRANLKIREFKSATNKKLFKGINNLLKIRAKEKAFHPNSEQKILFIGKGVFSLIRGRKILILINISGKVEKIKIPDNFKNSKDLISKKNIKRQKIPSELLAHSSPMSQMKEINLEPYEVLWLKKRG